MRIPLTIALSMFVGVCHADELFVAKTEAPVFFENNVKTLLRRHDVIQGSPHPADAKWVRFSLGDKPHAVEAKYLISERDIQTLKLRIVAMLSDKEAALQRALETRNALKTCEAIVAGTSREGSFSAAATSRGAITTNMPGVTWSGLSHFPCLFR